MPPSLFKISRICHFQASTPADSPQASGESLTMFSTGTILSSLCGLEEQITEAAALCCEDLEEHDQKWPFGSKVTLHPTFLLEKLTHKLDYSMSSQFQGSMRNHGVSQRWSTERLPAVFPLNIWKRVVNSLFSKGMLKYPRSGEIAGLMDHNGWSLIPTKANLQAYFQGIYCRNRVPASWFLVTLILTDF